MRPFAPRAARAAPPFRGGRSRQMRFGWDGFYCGSHPGPGAGPELRDRVTELPVRRHTARSPLAPPVLAGRAPCQEERPDQEGPGGPRSPRFVWSAYSMRAPREKPFLPGLNHPSKQLRPRFHLVTTPPRQAHVEARPSRSASETGLFARSVTPQASAGGRRRLNAAATSVFCPRGAWPSLPSRFARPQHPLTAAAPHGVGCEVTRGDPGGGGGALFRRSSGRSFRYSLVLEVHPRPPTTFPAAPPAR